MKVKLPRSCRGDEIIEAFKQASSISGEKVRWVPEEYRGKIEFEPGSVVQINYRGVKSFREELVQGKSHWFREDDPPSWQREFNALKYTAVVLGAIRQDREYDEIDIDIGSFYIASAWWGTRWIEDRSKEGLVVVEKIVEKLYRIIAIN